MEPINYKEDGTNHHKSCITFGAAFSSHENKESYKWLLKNFLKAMEGDVPKLIITDEDLSMKMSSQAPYIYIYIYIDYARGTSWRGKDHMK